MTRLRHEWHVFTVGHDGALDVLVAILPGSWPPSLHVRVEVAEDGTTAAAKNLQLQAAEAIAEFLNGGPRPGWLDDMEPTLATSDVQGLDDPGAVALRHVDGTTLTVRGVYVPGGYRPGDVFQCMDSIQAHLRDKLARTLFPSL